MTLYEIDQKIRDAIEYGCDSETGEIIDDTALRELEMARDEKIENICLFIKDLKAEAEAIKAEKVALDSREKSATRKAESLSNYLQNMLNGEKFKTSRCVVSYRKSQAVMIDDLEALPDQCVRIKKEADKMAIKSFITSGATVAGAHLEDRQSMIIK